LPSYRELATFKALGLHRIAQEHIFENPNTTLCLSASFVAVDKNTAMLAGLEFLWVLGTDAIVNALLFQMLCIDRAVITSVSEDVFNFLTEAFLHCI